MLISGKKIEYLVWTSTIFLSIWMTYMAPCAFGEDTYANTIKKVAILPLRNLSGDIMEEIEIRKVLADVLKSKKNVEVLDFSHSDKLLADKGIKLNKAIKPDDLKIAGKTLHVDGILFGNITTYHVPTQGEKSAGTFIPFIEAIAKVEASLKFYDCFQDRITWNELIIGYSKPFVLKIESIAVNMNSAIDSFRKDFESSWLRGIRK